MKRQRGKFPWDLHWENIQAKEVFCLNMASRNRWVMLACSIIKYRNAIKTMSLFEGISVIQIFNKGKIIKLILFCYETMSCRLPVVASNTPIFSYLGLSPHEREFSLGFWIPRQGFRILSTGFRFFVSGTWIPDSNPLWDSGFLELYSGFHKLKFRDSGIPLHGARHSV